MVPALGQREYLLYLSRIHPKKGCDLLIEAFGRVAGRFSDVDLVLAGPDHVGLTEQLKQLAAKAGISHRIHWPGMLQGEAKWGAYQGATAFILPSHQENFGSVVAEAMACGKPVLISIKVNIWREVEAAGAGFVADDTAAGTLSLLERLLPLSMIERQQLGVAARRAYERHFSAEGAARDLTLVLQGVIEETSFGR
jgi:glycosyltransferase involved in cell wall biosynthesis